MTEREVLTTTELLEELQRFKPAVQLGVDAIREYAARRLAPAPLKKSSGGRGVQKLWPAEAAAEIAASYFLVTECGFSREEVAAAREIALKFEASGHTRVYEVISDVTFKRVLFGKQREVFLGVQWLITKFGKLSRDSAFIERLRTPLSIIAMGEDLTDNKWRSYTQDAFLTEIQDVKARDRAKRAFDHQKKCSEIARTKGQAAATEYHLKHIKAKKKKKKKK
jgi:hypothetical protein